MTEEAIHPLRAAREARNCSQKDLAEAVGLGARTIWAAEHGKPVSAHSRRCLSRYFKQSAQQLGLVTQANNPQKKHQQSAADRENIVPSVEVLTPALEALPEPASLGTMDSLYTDSLLARAMTVIPDPSTWISLKIAQILHMISGWSSQQRLCCNEIQATIDKEIKMLDETLHQQHTSKELRVSRRQALTIIAALPTALLIGERNLGQTTTVMPEEFLPQSAASITACWHLLQGDGLAEVEQILPKFAPILTNLTEQASKHQQMVAYLAAQANILQAIIAMHRLNIPWREKYCWEAIKCGYLSKENRLTAAALMYLGYTYSFCYRPQRPQQAIQTFLEALRVLGNEDCLLKSDIAMGLAEAYAQCRDEGKALEYLTIAQNCFPTYPESDPSFLYAECGLNTLYQWEGKMYLGLAEYYPDKSYQ